jgi:RNA polymerase sigma-70 factor (ECF subfamily)
MNPCEVSDASVLPRAANREADRDEVLATCAVQDPGAFAVLYERYFPRVHRYVLARSRDPNEVEDVVSAIWMRVCSKISLYRLERGPFAPWLFALARNVLHDAMRQNIRRPIVIWNRDIAGVTSGPETHILAAEGREEMRHALLSLTVDQREALALRYAADLSFREIGQALGKSEAAAKMLVRRGIEGLRRQFPEQG